MSLTFKQYLTKNKTTPNHNVWGGVGYFGSYGLGTIGNESSMGGSEDEEIIKKNTPDTEDRPDSGTEDRDTEDIGDETEGRDMEDDPDKQGIIRVVKGARLVYKRETDDGTFEELWMFKTGNVTRDEFQIKKDILAGTDIPTNKTASEDDEQSYTVWASGNVQMMKINGLPN